MHGFKMCHFCLKQREVPVGSQSCRVYVRLIKPFYFADWKVKKCGETRSDDIHQLVLWNPLEAFDFIALQRFLLLI